VIPTKVKVSTPDQSKGTRAANARMPREKAEAKVQPSLLEKHNLEPTPRGVWLAKQRAYRMERGCEGTETCACCYCH
jgi:hypothetical protein